MSQQTTLATFFKKSGDDSEKKSSGGTDKLSPEASSSEPPAKKSKVLTPRGFCEDWLKRFNWLFLDDDGSMKCNPCVNTKQTNPFVNGCSNFRVSTLTRHQETLSHNNALKTLKLRSDFKKSTENVESLQNETFKSAESTKRHIVQLRTVYCMAKNGISASNFVPLMQLQKDNECLCADQFYTKPEIVCEMEQVINNQIHKTLIKQIKDSSYFGIMLDETCDISIEKKLVVYVRFIKDGDACIVYLGNKRVTDCTAEGIKIALCNFLEESGIIRDGDYSCLMGLGTDGAAVMVGRKNGLGVKLKTLNDKLIQVHCVAHRLNLAASQASKGIKYMEDYRQYISTLYRFFSDSQVRYDKLRDLQTLLHGHVKQVPEGTSVRWLSVESAVKMIYEYYDCIILTLEDDKDKTGKASGLWKFLSDSLFLLITALLIDVLTVIGILSLIFQRDSVSLASIKGNVESSLNTLNTMRNGSPIVDHVLEILDPQLQDPNTVNTQYKQVKITDNQNLRTRFNAIRRNYLDNMINNLGDRFPDDELSLLECFDIVFNPKRYPTSNQELTQYGNVQLNELCLKYSDIINADTCKGQFLQFKHFVVAHKGVYSDFDKLCKLLITEYSDIYPDFVTLVSIAQVIPVSSAPCERGFSQQNILKSKVRNRLSPDRVDRLLMIRLNGPKEIDFLAAAREFASLKERKK